MTFDKGTFIKGLKKNAIITPKHFIILKQIVNHNFVIFKKML